MVKVVFKNLKKSDYAKEAALLHMEDAVERFPALKNGRVVIRLSMENSPTQAGPDSFTAKFRCRSGKYKGVILERTSDNLYRALAELSDDLLERLNRFSDKERVRKRKQERRFNNFDFVLNFSPNKS